MTENSPNEPPTGTECPECAHWAAMGARYCRNCGRPLPAAAPAPKRFELLHGAAIACAVLVAVCMVYSSVYLFLDLGSLFAAADGLTLRLTVYLGIYPFRLVALSGTALKAYLLFLLIVEALCILYAIKVFIQRAAQRTEDRDDNLTERTGLTAAGTALAFTLAFSYVSIMLMLIFDCLPDSSWINEYSTAEKYILFANAGFWEEITDRVLFIGLPMALIALCYRKDRKSWQYLLGGFGMSRTAMVLLVISAVLFGLGHLNGWGWSKVPMAAFSGLLFGYVYIQYGLYASVIMHTVNDVSLTVIENTMGTGVSALMILAVCALGLAVLIYWVLKPRLDAVDPRRMAWFPEKLEGTVGARWARKQ